MGRVCTVFQPLSSHELLIFLLQFAAFLGMALLLGRLAARIGMPAVAGELCAGVILGPSLLGHVAPELLGFGQPSQAGQSHLIDAVGQIGVLLLVGLSGTQLDFGLARRSVRTIAYVGAASLVLPFALAAGCGFLLPGSLIGANSDRVIFACFIGVAMAVSAIPVIAKMLLDMGLLHRDFGQLTLAVSVIDDTAGWIMLSALTPFAARRGTQQAAHVTLTLTYLAAIIIGALLLGRPAAKLGLKFLNRSTGPATYSATIVILILLAAAGADSLGFEPVFGAFICGVLLGSAGGLDRSKLVPLRAVVTGILAPVFFATAGLRVNIDVLRSPTLLGVTVFVLIIAVIGKFTGAFLGASLSHLDRWEAIALGAGLNARGVIQIVIATVGLSIKVLTVDSYTIIVFVAIATSMMAPPILRQATRRIEKSEEEDQRAELLIVPTRSS